MHKYVHSISTTTIHVLFSILVQSNNLFVILVRHYYKLSIAHATQYCQICTLEITLIYETTLFKPNGFYRDAYGMPQPANKIKTTNYEQYQCTTGTTA